MQLPNNHPTYGHTVECKRVQLELSLDEFMSELIANFFNYAFSLSKLLWFLLKVCHSYLFC